MRLDRVPKTPPDLTGVYLKLDRAEAHIETVREKMQGAASLAVPLTVDVGIGDNWREAKS